MKHALLNVEKMMPRATIISFFFNARGNIFEKSTLGMYRSLLLQLMGVPVLQDAIARLYKKKRSRQDISEWSISELQDAFLSAIQSLQKQQLVCFIDALDECAEEEVRAMIKFLEKLVEVVVSIGGFFKICLSSRHYPQVTIRKALQLTVDAKNGHITDIATYIESKFNAPSSTQTDEIKAEILARASGVFLWVILVVQMLNKAYNHGQIHAMRCRLNKIPDELNDLFADILTQDMESRDESTLCLQLLLFAQRPLKREELYFAVLSGTDPIKSVEWDRSEISQENIDRFIFSCSKGLVEVSRAKDETVQSIHESVRDFIIYRNGLAKPHVSLTLDVTGLSHKRLTECCNRYINEVIKRKFVGQSMNPRNIRQLVCSGLFPFLQYAVQNLFRHSNTAQGYGFSQKEFLRRFCCEMANGLSWKDLNDAFSPDDTSYELKTELLYILSDQNLPNLVRILLDDGVKADAYGKVYGTAIQVAAAHGSQEVFELLLAAGADINIKGGKYRHTLAAAVISQNEDIVQILKNKVIKAEQDILDDALYNAIMWGNTPSIEFLLDIGANLNIKPLDCSSPLEVAVNERHETAVRALLWIGVDKNGLTTRILHHAIVFGNVGTVIQFLDQGFDQFEADSDGWTALSLATVHNAEAVVQLLLERPGVDPVFMARDIELSLFYAKQKDNGRILQLLEEAMKRISESTSPAKPEAVSNHTRPAEVG